MSHTIGNRLQLRLRPPANQVHRRAILWWMLQDGIFWAVVVIAAGVGLFFAGAPLWMTLIWIALVVIGLLDATISPRLRYRAHRWEVTEQAVYVQFGVVMREWRIAPLSRVQTVDTQRGPLQQWLGLSTVTVTTASAAGPLKIKGLAKDDAAELVDRLTAITEATPGDAT